MVTVQEIFDAAMDLMDEQDENTGSTQTADTKEYQLRTISILNTALPALYPYSYDKVDESEGRPNVAPLMAVDRKEPDFTQYIPLDDALCWGLLPFWLASFLRSGEDTEFSMRMMTEYNKALATIRDLIPAEFEAIPMPFGAW